VRPIDPRVFQALPEARRIMAGLGALGVALGVAAVAQAFAVSAVVVAVVHAGMPGSPGLPTTLLALGAVFAARAGLGALNETYAARAGIRVSAALRERLLARWLASPLDRMPPPATASTLATQGITTVEPYVARFLPAMVGAVVLPAFVVVTIAFLDWVSALIVVLTVPLLPVFAALIGRVTQDRTERRWQALTALSGHFLDVVRGLPTLVTYGRAERQADSIKSVSEAHRAATVRTLRVAFLSSAALELLATISVAIVAVTVGLRLTYGTMELAPGLACILLAPEAYWPIRRVGTEYHAAADGVAALSTVLDELADPPAGSAAGTAGRSAGSPATGTTASLPFGTDQLSYRYPGTDRDVLRELSIRLPEAGLVTVTGPSGVGKSTLLDLLARLREPSCGLVSAPEAHLVGQRPLLVTGSLRANLTLGLDTPPNDDALWAALDEVGLGDDLRGLSGGLDAPIGDDGFGLSAGQRARLALARATLSEAAMVLLDEPTAHLDDRSARLAHTTIRRLARTRSVVVVTHRPELVDLADAVIRVGSDHG
jgi:thiol reductant ABC exporter CydD subunit